MNWTIGPASRGDETYTLMQVELTLEQDLPKLLSEGVVHSNIVTEEGVLLVQYAVVLKKRGR